MWVEVTRAGQGPTLAYMVMAPLIGILDVRILRQGSDRVIFLFGEPRMQNIHSHSLAMDTAQCL